MHTDCIHEQEAALAVANASAEKAETCEAQQKSNEAAHEAQKEDDDQDEAKVAFERAMKAEEEANVAMVRATATNDAAANALSVAISDEADADCFDMVAVSKGHATVATELDTAGTKVRTAAQVADAWRAITEAEAALAAESAIESAEVARVEAREKIARRATARSLEMRENARLAAEARKQAIAAAERYLQLLAAWRDHDAGAVQAVALAETAAENASSITARAYAARDKLNDEHVLFSY